MSKLTKTRMFGGQIWAIYILYAIVLITLWYNQWLVGLGMTILFGLSFYYSVQSERRAREETEEYIRTLSYRIKKVGEEALLEMPIGIILYNNDFKIEWVNPYMNQLTDNNSIVGSSLDELSDQMIPAIEEGKNEIRLTMEPYTFQTEIKHKDRLIYLFDRTEQAKIEKLYHNEQTVIAMIYLDNYEE